MDSLGIEGIKRELSELVALKESINRKINKINDKSKDPKTYSAELSQVESRISHLEDSLNNGTYLENSELSSLMEEIKKCLEILNKIDDEVRAINCSDINEVNSSYTGYIRDNDVDSLIISNNNDETNQIGNQESFDNSKSHDIINSLADLSVDEKHEKVNNTSKKLKNRVSIFPELSTIALDISFNHRLQPQDSIGKHIHYTPRMIWHNPRSNFPSLPLKNFNSPSYFQQLSLDTLFFIFYFQQGTFQQLLATQELKKKKWRFHKKCFAWFYKRSESKVVTDETEVADFVYFDFEKDWCQKIKSDFTFEFAHFDQTSPILSKSNN
ncbi:NOT2 NOT3 NOT5 family protein [Cryptosporidium andersoni]|uniref:NOT2 NOT3 NOT5 family protein n=1 Tax=Cryptosporidium andersoni TaxID=117008 RepID=A0A1J4MV05_9CRYT|nr:NOT2 NOT3 NOT5 family protein [Cryptosporidium andersoni]